ncbi:protein kinase [Streptomyces monticola]|uniref:Protein kinase n=1 Tax=Streptomyces monticola TaxID=2666263 RepID=A0ABW2JV56_9ACTN
MGEVPAVWQIGDVIDGRYEVTDVHLAGAMGIVHRVRHLVWGSDLAVKSPWPELFQRPGDQERFIAEAQTWVSLGLHPHVCGCYYVRTLGGVPRVFTEYVGGGSLADWIDDRRLYEGGPGRAVRRILDLAIQISWGLEHAHEQGLVHQDIKPANVLVDASGPDGTALTAKVTDFGLARARQALPAPVPGEQPHSGTVLVANGGMTPAYASPEQAAGHQVGRRSDIYSFAVSVLEMFTGGIDWPRGTAGDALAAYLADGPAEAGLPELPADVGELLAECLRRHPADRPPAMSEVTERLTALYRRATGRGYPGTRPVAADLRADEFNNHALSLLDLGRTADAEETFALALAADPQHPQATYNAGLLQWRRGALTDEDLVARTEAAAAAADAPWQARHLLALAHLERGDLASAGPLLDTAVRAAPGEADVEATVRTVRSGSVPHARCVATGGGHWQRDPGVYMEIPPHAAAREVPVRISGDGQVAVTGDREGVVRVWNVPDGRCLHAFREHDGRVLSVDVTDDGRFAVSVGAGHVAVRDLTDGRLRWTFPSDDPHGYVWVWSVRISAGGGFVVGAGADGRVLVWDCRADGARRELAGHSSGVSLVEVGDGGRFALSSGGDDTARLWDLYSGECRQVLELAEAPVALALSGDASRAVTGDHDGSLRLWDLRSGVCLRTLTGHVGEVKALSLSADARHLLSCGKDRSVRYWDLDAGRCLRTFRGHEDTVSAVRLGSGFGISAAQDNTTRWWTLPGTSFAGTVQLARPRPPAELNELVDLVAESVAAAEDAMAAGDHASALALLTRARALPGHERSATALSAWRALDRCSARVGLRTAWESRTLEGPEHVRHVALSADGRIGASSSYRGTEVRVWDLGSGTCVHTLDVKEPTALWLSPDGRRLRTVGDGELRTWRVSTGECLSTVRLGSQAWAAARFSADGRTVLVRSDGVIRSDGLIRAWDVDSGKPWPHAIEGPDRLHTLWVDTDSRRALGDEFTASADSVAGALRVWDLDSGRCLHVLEGHTSWLPSVCLSPDGRHALSTSLDKTIRLWDITTGTQVRTFEAHPGHAAALSFVGDGRWALSGGSDGTLRLWDVATGRCVRTLTGHQKGVSALAVAPGGHFVLSGSDDGAVRLWEFDWELDAREPCDWDDGALPYAEMFLRRHGPQWPEAAFEALLDRLRDVGYGWLRAEGVRARLRELALLMP